MAKQYQPFKFKQFEVAQDMCAMKVGTDGVLLGAWTTVVGKNILDIGTGTGLITLMMAQRNPEAQIDAIDIDPAAVKQAAENFQNSPWSLNLKSSIANLIDYHPRTKYDLLVTNPPYFTDSTLPPLENRHKARHTTELNAENLLSAANNLLKENGKLSLILPFTEGENFILLAKDYDMFPEKITKFYSRPTKPVERLLLTFSRHTTAVKFDTLCHYNEHNEWTEEYKALTREFYIVI